MGTPGLSVISAGHHAIEGFSEVSFLRAYMRMETPSDRKFGSSNASFPKVEQGKKKKKKPARIDRRQMDLCKGETWSLDLS